MMPIVHSAIGGLSQQAVAAMHGVLSKHPAVSRVVLFDSPATGDHGNGSDIDLAVFGSVDARKLERIARELDDLHLLLPREIDLIAYERIADPTLRVQIDSLGKIFYERLEGNPSRSACRPAHTDFDS